MGQNSVEERSGTKRCADSGQEQHGAEEARLATRVSVRVLQRVSLSVSWPEVRDLQASEMKYCCTR